MAALMLASAVRDDMKKVLALTKPESKRIAHAEDSLRPFEDQKMAIYQQQLEEMSLAFAKSREVRSGLSEEYDNRNKQVMDKLQFMKARTDKEARQHLDMLKAFSDEFDETASAAKKKWRQQFILDQAAHETSSTALGDVITNLNAAIAQEHEDCIAHASAETGPIIEALERHRSYLAQQIAEREAQNFTFESTLREQFARLRRRRAEEILARKEQYAAGSAEAAKRFQLLSEHLQSQEEVAAREIEKLRQLLAHERKETLASEELIVGNMMNFMAEFEANNAETNARQETLKAHLLSMKATLREDGGR